MTDMKKSNRIIAKLMVIVIFLFSAMLLGLSLWVIVRVLIGANILPTEINNILSKVLPYVVTIGNLIITTIVTAVVKSKVEIWFNAPQIIILPNYTNGSNVSGSKKEQYPRYENLIILGNKLPEYRIINAIIKNVGRGDIAECQLNGQRSAIILPSGNQCKLHILVYTAVDEETQSINDSQIFLPYTLVDNNGVKFSGIYRIQMDTVKGRALFHIHKKIKRERI